MAGLFSISGEILGWMTIADSIAKAFRDNIPTIQDEVVVEVVGQPGASKRELYYLAMAAANGIVKRRQPLLQLNPFLPPSAASLMIEYDAADHWIRCSLTYRSAALTAGSVVAAPDVLTLAADAVVAATTALSPVAAFTAFMTVATSGIGFFGGAAVYRGPQCDVVGDQLAFTSTLPPLPGVPLGIGVGGAPDLPWAGRPILTSCPGVLDPRPIPPIMEPPVSEAPLAGTPGGRAAGARGTLGPPIFSPNPKPVGDNRSRGAVVAALTTADFVAGASAIGPDGCCNKTMRLVELVSAALTDPGSDAFETWTPPVVGPLATPGPAVWG